MSNKRHQIEERTEFTEEERFEISQKSDECCAWCGKKVYFGYGATVDHYIPVKKGGTNDMINLVMMCKDCNLKKGSKIIPLNIAGKYIKEPYATELGEHFEDYLKQFDYVSRGNLMCCDMYEMYFIPEIVADARHKMRKHGKDFNIDLKKSRSILKRAYPDDEDRIVEYYIKYLTKYDMLHSPEAARNNIKFWLRFGTIYFVEKNDEIAVISSMLMNKNGYLSINLFPYYSTPLIRTIARGVVTCIGDAITNENDIPYLPISVNMLARDTLAPRVLELSRAIDVDARFICTPYFIYNEEYESEPDVELAKKHYDEGMVRYNKFMSNFRDVEDSVRLYLYDEDMMDSDWLAEEMLERNVMEGIEPYFDFLKD